MPALARNHQVVAVDPRGVGSSDKPRNGYDTGTLADDMVALMTALGHERFAMVGHDIGMWTGYALAADHPDRLDRLTIAGAHCSGDLVEDTMRLAADTVESLVLPDCGHYPAEEAPRRYWRRWPDS